MFGDNGEAVLCFLEEPDRRPDRDAPRGQRISSRSWKKNSALVEAIRGDRNRLALIRGARAAAYEIAQTQGIQAACDTSAVVKDAAKFGAGSQSMDEAGSSAERAAQALALQKHLPQGPSSLKLKEREL
jgi:hypothetical protein